MARDEADRELQAEKDTQASLLNEIDQLSDQLTSIQDQLERSNIARSEAETRAMALASQMSHTQSDLAHHQLMQTTHIAQIAVLEKQVKELEEQLAVKESVVVVTSGSQTIPNPVTEHSSQTIPPNPVTEHSSQTVPPNSVTEHSSQTTQSLPIAGIPIHTQTTLRTLDMATNTPGGTPFVTEINEREQNRGMTVQSTPEINQLQMKITALSNELANRLNAQVNTLPYPVLSCPSLHFHGLLTLPYPVLSYRVLPYDVCCYCRILSSNPL